MNDGIDGLVARLKKIATFPQRTTYYSIAVTPDEAEKLVALLAKEAKNE
jgi:hypothetical protein